MRNFHNISGQRFGRLTAKQVETKRERRDAITFNDETHSMTEWARLVGIHPMSLHGRLKRGWPLDKALVRRSG